MMFLLSTITLILYILLSGTVTAVKDQKTPVRDNNPSQIKLLLPDLNEHPPLEEEEQNQNDVSAHLSLKTDHRVTSPKSLNRYQRIVEARKKDGTFYEWRKKANERVQKYRSEMSDEKKLETSRKKNQIKKQRIAASTTLYQKIRQNDRESLKRHRARKKAEARGEPIDPKDAIRAAGRPRKKSKKE